MRDALYATLASTLGLSSREVAEIGGFSDRFARDLLAGRRPFPRDVAQALLAIKEDAESIAEAILEGDTGTKFTIWMYGDNDSLRAARPDIPGRGEAAGGFIGPYRMAALDAWDALGAEGVEVDILFSSS